MKDMVKHDIVVLIPCFNEEMTVGDVINGFRKEIPQADIYVFDNNSTDNTANVAKNAGVNVIREHRQGKGNVIRSMFRQIKADIYILVDGDDTYPPEEVLNLMDPVIEGKADVVVGDRISSLSYDSVNSRPFHSFGNRLVRWLINFLFKTEFKDILSGYRVFNSYFVNNFPVMTEGFEIETEITLHALDKRFNIIEIPIQYKERPEGSKSKLNTYSDGMRILKTIVFVFKNYKPMLFFGLCSVTTAILGLIVGAFPIYEYFKYSYIYKVPSAILASALEILAVLFFGCGLILDTSVRQHKETYELNLIKSYKKLS